MVSSLSSLEEEGGIQLFVETYCTRSEFDGLEKALQNIGMKPLTESKLVHIMRSAFVLELYYRAVVTLHASS
jgi:hypothetical protein